MMDGGGSLPPGGGFRDLLGVSACSKRFFCHGCLFGAKPGSGLFLPACSPGACVGFLRFLPTVHRRAHSAVCGLLEPERGARLWIARVCSQEPPLAPGWNLLCSPSVHAPAWAHVFWLMSPSDSSAFGAFTLSFGAGAERSRLALNFSCSLD